MRINHIAVWVQDLERMKAFYKMYFDCKANEIYTNSKKQFSSCFLSFSDGSRIELMQRADISTRPALEMHGWAHIAIDVGSKENVDALTAKLEKDGFKIISYPRVTGDGYYESVIGDPEGNLIELTYSN